MKIVLFYFKMAIKMQGRHKKIRVGRVSGNTAYFFRPKATRIKQVVRNVNEARHQKQLFRLRIVIDCTMRSKHLFLTLLISMRLLSKCVFRGKFVIIVLRNCFEIPVLGFEISAMFNFVCSFSCLFVCHTSN